MPKKVILKKKVSPRKTPNSGAKKKPSPIDSTQKSLNDNFIALQKVMTNLAIKFDSLSSQISQLLNLFEISAKALAEKDFDFEKSNKDNKKIIEKLDTLSEQNKIIARGLTLMHEKFEPESEEVEEEISEQRPMPSMRSPRPLPTRPMANPANPQAIKAQLEQKDSLGRASNIHRLGKNDQYYKSIADQNKEKPRQ